MELEKLRENGLHVAKRLRKSLGFAQLHQRGIAVDADHELHALFGQGWHKQAHQGSTPRP